MEMQTQMKEEREHLERLKRAAVPPSTPYTLHPALHPTPYTLHHTPYTLHPTPYALHSTPYTLHPTPQIPNPVATPKP